MSRRNQVRRRRTYARRQHEVRERRGGQDSDLEWQTRDDEFDWAANGPPDHRGGSEGGAFEGMGR